MPPSYAFLSLTRAKPSIYAPLIVPESFLAPLQGNAFGTYRRPRVQRGTLGRHFRTFLSLGGAGQNYIRMTGVFGDDTHSSSPKSTAADPSVSRTCRFTHETSLEDPSVSRMRRFAHETSLADPSVSRTRLFAHETAAKDTRGNRGAFSASYGNSMETLRALYGRSSMPPRFDQSQWDS